MMFPCRPLGRPILPWEVAMQSNFLRSTVLAGAVATALCVLGLWGGVSAQPQQGGQQPFRNAVEQREELIQVLREIKLLLKEQNSLLRTLTAKGPADAPKRN